MKSANVTSILPTVVSPTANAVYIQSSYAFGLIGTDADERWYIGSTFVPAVVIIMAHRQLFQIGVNDLQRTTSIVNVLTLQSLSQSAGTRH
jgi:hypothetical protein